MGMEYRARLSTARRLNRLQNVCVVKEVEVTQLDTVWTWTNRNARRVMDSELSRLKLYGSWTKASLLALTGNRKGEPFAYCSCCESIRVCDCDCRELDYQCCDPGDTHYDAGFRPIFDTVHQIESLLSEIEIQISRLTHAQRIEIPIYGPDAQKAWLRIDLDTPMNDMIDGMVFPMNSPYALSTHIVFNYVDQQIHLIAAGRDHNHISQVGHWAKTIATPAMDADFGLRYEFKEPLPWYEEQLADSPCIANVDLWVDPDSPETPGPYKTVGGLPTVPGYLLPTKCAHVVIEEPI